MLSANSLTFNNPLIISQRKGSLPDINSQNNNNSSL